jgi:hypothetical protein
MVPFRSVQDIGIERIGHYLASRPADKVTMSALADYAAVLLGVGDRRRDDEPGQIGRHEPKSRAVCPAFVMIAQSW